MPPPVLAEGVVHNEVARDFADVGDLVPDGARRTGDDIGVYGRRRLNVNEGEYDRRVDDLNRGGDLYHF